MSAVEQQAELAGKYRPYPDYKDSGVEWLGAVPSTWTVAKTTRYFKIAMGQTILKEQLEDDAEWPVYSATEGEHFFGHVNNPQVRLDYGDLVIPARGNSIGFVKLVKGRATTTQTTIYCKHITKKILPEYAYYFMIGHKGSLFWFTQTAIPQITVEEVGSNPLLLPSQCEQSTIAAFLDYETARIDRLIAQQQRLIELLKEKRQAVISHAVTKGLNPNAPMKDSGVEWLGQVPEHWKVGSLRWYLRVSSGEYLSNQHFDLEPSESAIYPVIGGNGLMGYTSHKNQATPLVVGRVGALCGNVHLVDGECWVTDNALLIGLSSKISVNFAAHYLKSLNLNKLANQNTQPLITGTMIKDQNIALPPLHEQSEIVEFVTQEEQKLNLLVAKAEQAIVLMQERRTALIAAAVTGKIDLRGWTTPADEVAV